MQQSLVNGSQRSFPSTSCHYCEGIQNALRVDSESGIASYFNDNAKGWVSLLDSDDRNRRRQKAGPNVVPVQPWEEEARFAYQNKLAEDYKKISERREQVEAQASSTMLEPLRKTCLCKLDDLH